MTAGRDGQLGAGRGIDRVRRTADAVAFVVAIAISAVVLFAPSTDGLPIFPYADKLVHASVFALLCWRGIRAGMRPLLLAAALVGYAIASEVIQATVLPHRAGDVTDVLADSLGIAIGLLWTWSGRCAVAHLLRRLGLMAPTR